MKRIISTLIALCFATTIYAGAGLVLDPKGDQYDYSRVKATWLVNNHMYAYSDTLWKFAMGNTAQNLLFCNKTNKTKDFDIANSTNPTIWGFSSMNPEIDSRQYWYIKHDSSNMIFSSGLGAQFFQLDALKGWGQLTFTGSPNNNETMVINATTITAKTTGPTTDQFRIGASITETIDSLVACINAGTEKNNVTAARVGSTCVITSDNAGAAYNYVFTEAFSNVTISGSGTLTGARDAVSGTPGHSPNHYFPGIVEFDKHAYFDNWLTVDTIAIPIDTTSANGPTGYATMFVDTVGTDSLIIMVGSTRRGVAIE